MLVAAPRAPTPAQQGDTAVGALAEPPTTLAAAWAAHLLPEKAFHPLCVSTLGCRHLWECLFVI